MTSVTERAGSSPTPSAVRLVAIYRHDSGEIEEQHWTLPELVAAIRRLRPRGRSAPNATFSVGTRPDYLSISTKGPARFVGQHPVWAENGKFEGAMLFSKLRFRDVLEALEKFYDGRTSETAMAPFDGVFQFYTPDPETLKSDAMRRCRRCGVVRPIAEFSMPPERSDLCCDCENDMARSSRVRPEAGA